MGFRDGQISLANVEGKKSRLIERMMGKGTDECAREAKAVKGDYLLK